MKDFKKKIDFCRFAFRELWAYGSCNFENFQNISSDHKSRNARAGSYDFLFIIFSNLCSNLTLPRCFHGNFSVLHSITSIALYNLFMHSSLTNQKRDILLSI